MLTGISSFQVAAFQQSSLWFETLTLNILTVEEAKMYEVLPGDLILVFMWLGVESTINCLSFHEKHEFNVVLLGTF